MVDSGEPAPVELAELFDRYDGFLLDAYGVLNDAEQALPGARELLEELARRRLPYLVVTNDASRLPTTASARFRQLGLDIPPDAILMAGALLASHFAQQGLVGRRCLVLGTADSCQYVRDAGGVIVPLAPDADHDVVAVCDDDGYPFLAGLNTALSAICRALDAGRSVHLVLPNPDLIYPNGSGFGFTSGAAAMLLEAALLRRYPDLGLTFTRLGKPNRPLFDEAIRRLGTRHLLMIGDQLETDIAGARGADLDAALLATGVSRTGNAASPHLAPTYLLSTLVTAPTD